MAQQYGYHIIATDTGQVLCGFYYYGDANQAALKLNKQMRHEFCHIYDLANKQVLRPVDFAALQRKGR